MRVLFCGFDGVLHPRDAARVPFGIAPTRLFEWVDVLAALLAPHPETFVVVHSAWRHEFAPMELAPALGPIAGQWLGCVPPGPTHPAILAWLARNPTVDTYRVLDDDPRQFPDPPPPQLLLCHPNTGVHEARVQRQLRAWLHGAPDA